MGRPIQSRSDDEIRAADVLLLGDPDQPRWQQLLWSMESDDAERDAATMEIVEIPVNSRDESQVEAVRERVNRLKKVRDSR